MIPIVDSWFSNVFEIEVNETQEHSTFHLPKSESEQDNLYASYFTAGIMILYLYRMKSCTYCMLIYVLGTGNGRVLALNDWLA